MAQSKLDEVVSLAKRRGFVFPAGEIYGGTRSAWDYGPLGVALKDNIKREWWRSMVVTRPDVVGVDTSIILPPEVWVASGHVSVFNDPLVECLNCHKRNRADKLEESYAEKHGDKMPENGRKDIVCPNCGMSYRDFQQTGKIGCSVCYATFRRQLEPLLRRIHGSSTHSGKIPHRTGGTLEMKHTIESLRKSLKECVAQEEYEKAAELRDKIRLLEHELAEKENAEGGESHVGQ